ncbi:Aldo/keto reductase [Candidatus Sulfobium mesophilum]|uniref:Aldo/keto reductase n=1 Tax=Candidatus Sulfobium mesophilum TaxID=2016548 RepID=A0A2U3QJN3_9BACT|nr:Aldo/keto reductase [Candidatus Sulfobium mesophilum]
MKMKKRQIGNSGLKVYPFAFGGNVFGWTVDEALSFRLLDVFTAAGFNLVDTADSYSKWVPGNRGGESETIIGKWLKRSGRRKDIIIATKVGSEMGPGEKGLSKSYIQRAVEKSLKRLQTDYIDLYQSHFDDPDTPMEETLEAYDQLIRQGKVRAIGASNYTAERLSQAVDIGRQPGYPRYQSLQTLYNLYDRRDYETNLEPLCKKEGLGVLTYFSLASGFLTGKYMSEDNLAGSARAEMVRKYVNERGFRILKALDQVSKKLNSKPACVALAWLIARPGITAPIASASNMEQLNDLIDATKLEPDHSSLQLLDKASAY